MECNNKNGVLFKIIDLKENILCLLRNEFINLIISIQLNV